MLSHAAISRDRTLYSSTASPRDGSNHRSHESHHNSAVEEALEDSANVTIAVTMKTKAFHSIVAQRIVEAAD